MRRVFCYAAGLAAACLLCPAARAGEPVSEPKLIPATRPEVKQALEALKHRTPRLPLPPLTDAERQAAGERPPANNGRMRALYLPKTWLTSTGRSNPDTAMTIDRVFRVQCFWIVSRANNCQYCLGHQELGLRSRGLSDNRIASLDADWSVFLPREQAAFALARKLTLAPHAIGDADVQTLRAHFTDREVVELIYTVAGFNSTNRWTDSMGIPQDRERGNLDSPTSERFLEAASLNAPSPDMRRPPLEPRAEVEAALSACRARSARVPLASDEEARAAMPPEAAQGPIPEWVRALAFFPKTAAAQLALRKAIAEEGRIDKLLKAQIAWTCARQNRAWYALGDARRRLAALGVSADEVFALDEPGESFSPAVREALAFARKLTAAPHTIADADVARLREHFSDHETAEVVFVTCNANMFDRFTEALGLQLEP
ncbi:MAG: hypothetical protein WD847_18430 [Pirellulales bacterium]